MAGHLVACGSPPLPEPLPAPPAEAYSEVPTLKPQVASPHPVQKIAEPPPIDPKDAERARALSAEGQKLYQRGDYDGAERALKEALTLYPFLADAHLVLGKIFLIRASSGRDMSMMNSARLMFEMARALDPAAREPILLLELFVNAKDR